MSSIFAVVAGRRAKYLVALVWLAIVGLSIGTNLVGKFTDAEKNESTSFLPGDAESTKALEVTTKLDGGELAPLVIVYHRDGGLTAEDRQVIARDRTVLNRKVQSGEFRSTSPFEKPVFSDERDAALVIAQIKADGEADTIIGPVDAVRKRMASKAGGLEVNRTEGLAIASLVCGIVGLIAVPLLPSIIAIVLGRQARTRIEESRGELEGAGLAKAGFILGIVGVVFWAIIAVLLIIGLAVFVALAPDF